MEPSGGASPVPRDEAGEADFEEFFMATREWLVGSVFMVTRNAPTAEDAVQEAYARAARRWGKVSQHDRPDLWVLRVATNLAIDQWRRHRREFELGERVTSRAHAVVDQEWLRWGLGHLSPRQRAAVVLHYAHGLPLRDIAERLEISEASTKTHLARARQRLRRLLAPEAGG